MPAVAGQHADEVIERRQPSLLLDGSMATVVVRAIGPSLASSGVSEPLSDPMLTIYNVNGSPIASNDNWGDAVNQQDMIDIGLAPRAVEMA